MTDKVRIDTLSASSLPQSNDTFLARQAEFESNVRSYPRKLPLAIAKAQGVWITDVENNQYLDCLAGAGTLALGHNHPDVLQSIQSVISSGLPLHTLDLTTPLKDEFSSYLLSLLPSQGKEYCLQFTGPSGADAVEAALKLAKKSNGPFKHHQFLRRLPWYDARRALRNR
ncbi:Diaminobutyrate--2-oxoglutarate aminotransferase [Serratia fonticola]|uniref:Diaminobutyrate--2-oxoglutarate aminotransferase n=1 Tax=Serratia fonticola TaxID=47917 RepID=A0A4U9TWB1_SERFO|nr:Diaminobutyrate--2-oxoglutarate aminotransferase [Serratia fonticola]